MKLFYAPGACSIGIHVLMEEIGAPYETVRLSIPAGDTLKPAFTAINPKAKVPTLQLESGRVLTEYPVVATYLAKTFPEAQLLPKGEEAELEAAEAMDYCVATIHMQGFSRLFRPGNFSPDEATHEAVKARGRELVDKAFAIMNATIEGRDWVAGEYSMADSALFYVEYWGGKRLGMQLPQNLAAHLERMLARPAVQRMLAQEGLAA